MFVGARLSSVDEGLLIELRAWFATSLGLFSNLLMMSVTNLSEKPATNDQNIIFA
ncbi:hypothetical protein W03_12970 [Nitrosomonas sp. PY1]|nr:hypothetical protein W03_12970 [Nitrosomonas sp. PY1]